MHDNLLRVGWYLLLGIGGVSSANGCSSSSTCGPNSSPGMTVQVLDLSQTSNQCIADSTVQITDGTYNETYSNACNYSGARNRPGTYTVTASAPGYMTTSISGVPIPVDCNSYPTPVELDLEKLPP